MAVTQYIGARYVPIFADPTEWSGTMSYEPLTIVTHEGNSYTSRQFVPVGIDITNEQYWALTGNYNAQVEQYRQEVGRVAEDVATNTEDIERIDAYVENVSLDFPNVASMISCDELTVGMTCRTDGFHAAGDGGGSTYQITSSGTADGMGIIALDNGNYAHLLIDDSLNVRQMGAVGDGANDDTASIQAAIDLLESLKDDVTQRFTKCFTLMVPEGTYKVTSTLKIQKSNILIKGVGSSSVFYAYAPTFDIIFIDGTNRNIYNSSISDVRFYTPNASAGANIKVVNLFNSIFTDIISNSAYKCLDLDSCNRSMFSQFIIDSVDRQANLGTGYLIDIYGENGTPSDLHFTDFQIVPNFLNQQYTARIRKCDGVYFENMHIHGGLLLSSQSTDTPLASLFFTNCYFDGATDCNVKFEGNTTSFRNIFFDNCYFRYASRNLYFYTNVENVFVSNCKFAQSKLSAIEVFGGKTLKGSVFNNILFSDTNTDNNTGACCILMRGKGNIITNVTVNNSDPTTIQLGTFINMSSTSEYCIVDLVNTINSYIQINAISNNGSNNVIGTNVIFGQSS